MRLLCGIERDLIAFLGEAEPIEGLTTHGTTGQRFEAALALRGEIGELTGRLISPGRYLIDADTGELVIRVGDLHRAARAVVGSSLPRGWVDGRMALLGWERVRLEGHSLPGREGRRSGEHARCNVYRGILADDDVDDSVNS